MWFKVDDQLALHPKILQAGNAAMGLWVRAGSWCGAHLTDGHVPDAMIRQLGTKSQAEALVRVGLWYRVGDGYQFHQWDEYQPSRAKVHKDRAATAERVRRWRDDHQSNAVTNAVSNAAPGNSAPTRPDPTREVRDVPNGTPRPENIGLRLINRSVPG